MKEIIGREIEKNILQEVLFSDEPELIAIYGRRRVGKTFLIRQFFEREMIFEFSGQFDTKTKDQLQNFSTKIDEFSQSTFPSIVPLNWTEAFNKLKVYLTPLIEQQKGIIFFDEFPWIDYPKSNFLSCFEYFWNDWASKKSNLKVVICGSAASWMIRKVIRNKGGLHNRVTKKIRLLPFSLKETEQYLLSKNIILDKFLITQLYMTFGGIPHYLKEVKKGESVVQLVDRVCFTKDGLLIDEFKNLFMSLFSNYEIHTQIVRELAKKRIGLTRHEIIENLKISSGGTITQIIEELEESGFITGYSSFGMNQKNTLYKLVDEYSLFYLKFIENQKSKQSWGLIQNTPSYRSWSGFSFESVCQKHTKEIKKALGISGIYTEESSWRDTDKDNGGTQIDLLINRNDNCINLCEIKFSESEFIIDKKYADSIQHKILIFKEKTKTKKTIFFTAISVAGFKMNEYKLRWVQNEVVLEDLFI
ncbi:MAG: ATP-binding protein [Arcicella sp.]|nr:ATP-binding protein [Arcicella sp.]